MALCNRIGLENKNREGLRKMRGVYVVMRDAYKEMKASKTPDMPSCDDMEDGRWQCVFGGIIAIVSARKVGMEASVEQMSNMFAYVTDAVESYKNNPETADKVARVILEDLYPKGGGGLNDGHQRAGGNLIDV